MGWWEKGESASRPPSLPPCGILLSPPPPCVHFLFFSPCKTQIKANGVQEKKKGHVVVLEERPGSAEPSFATA